MKYRGLVDKRGEVFALFDGDRLYTLDQEVTGRVEGDYIVDLSGNRVWRLLATAFTHWMASNRSDSLAPPALKTSER